MHHHHEFSEKQCQRRPRRMRASAIVFSLHRENVRVYVSFRKVKKIRCGKHKTKHFSIAEPLYLSLCIYPVNDNNWIEKKNGKKIFVTILMLFTQGINLNFLMELCECWHFAWQTQWQAIKINSKPENLIRWWYVHPTWDHKWIH